MTDKPLIIDQKPRKSLIHRITHKLSKYLTKYEQDTPSETYAEDAQRENRWERNF